MITIPYLRYTYIHTSLRYTYIHTSLRYTYIHTSLAQVLIFFLFILLRQWDMALFWLIFLLICCPAWSSSHQSDHNQHSCSLTQREGGCPPELSLSLSLASSSRLLLLTNSSSYSLSSSTLARAGLAAATSHRAGEGSVREYSGGSIVDGILNQRCST